MSLPIPLDAGGATPLYQQICDYVRERVTAGTLPAGTPLPATRELARRLGVSRNTVVTAYEQLVAEGYARGRVGVGTAVVDEPPRATPAAPAPVPSRRAAIRLSRAGRYLGRTSNSLVQPQGAAPRPFALGEPACDAAFLRRWSRLHRAVTCREIGHLLSYGDPRGQLRLREAIAYHLQVERALACTADEVLIVAGAQQALHLCARVLLDAGDEVATEDPGYAGARDAFAQVGARVRPQPVDAEGLVPPAGAPRGVYVTPSCQFPTGVVLSLRRRHALLAWAARAGGWIIEDDYDREFRYRGPALPSLHGLDGEGRVIHIGTFSKALYPGLRLGYLVAPAPLAAVFAAAKVAIDRQAPSFGQAVLALFLEGGHFARHLRRMTQLYRERQEALVAALAHSRWRHLPISGRDGGTHVVLRLPARVDDRALAAALGARGIEAIALSSCYLGRPEARGLILGYAAYSPGQLRYAVAQASELDPSRFARR